MGDYLETIGHYLMHYRFMVAGGYLTCVLCTGLSVVVYYANPHSRRCRYAALFNGAIGLWSFFYATHFYVTDKILGLLCTQFLSIGTILLSVFLTHFVLIETEQESKHKKFLIANYSLSTLLAIGLFIPGFILAYPVPKLGLPSYTDGGPFYTLIPLQLFMNLIYSCLKLWQALKKATGYRKIQLKLFSLALFVGYAAGTPAYLLVYDIPVPPTSAFLVFLVPLIFTYSIKKHQFLNITKFIKNTFIFSALLALLIALFSGVAFLLRFSISRWAGIDEIWAQFIAIAIVMPLVGPLRKVLSFLTNKVLYHQLDAPETIFKKLSTDILKNPNLQKLIHEVTNRIASILVLDGVAFFSKDLKNPGLFKIQATYGKFKKDFVHQTNPLIIHLQKNKDILLDTHDHREVRYRQKIDNPPFLANETQVRDQAILELSKLGGVAAVPVFVKDELHSLIILGNKKSHASWSRHDEELEALQAFIPHLSIALGTAEYAEELLRSRNKLLESEPDLTAGALIAGVDHEAKTPLHSMVLSISILQTRLQDPETANRPWDETKKITVSKIKRAMENVKEIHLIIRHLEVLSKKQQLHLEEEVKPKEVVKRVLHDLNTNGWPENVTLQSKIPSRLRLMCDPKALYAILNNLVVNARQAISHEGSITISGFRGVREVIVQVEDTGAGIAPQLVEKIFEPYFTTKKDSDKRQGGTGRGLFIVRQTMKEFGGDIEVASEEGKGTIFKLHFPDIESVGRKAA